MILYKQQALFLSESKRDHSKIKDESVKKSLEKSKNVLEEKRKMFKRKICIKKIKTFTIIAMNFVQEQLITSWTDALPSHKRVQLLKYPFNVFFKKWILPKTFKSRSFLAEVSN